MTAVRTVSRVGAVGAVLLAWAMPAWAQRPDTPGGLYSFDETDVIESLDGPAGEVRVHYSVDGPNVTRLRDGDGSGLPDFPEDVASVAEDVLGAYEEAGFSRPIAEAEMGLGDLGGSQALDFYLVDFAGVGDGNFATDVCRDGRCSGYMVMENDFIGYGYPSISAAIRILTSHELFHAVQAAYRDHLEIWLSEGTATWAEKLFDEDSVDFRWFASRYLEDTGRPIDRPPAEPVPAFAYATCLFWEFLSLRHGNDVIVEVLEQSEALDGLDAVEAALEAFDSSFPEEWGPFGEANLMTGPRAGDAAFYPFAADIDGIEPTADPGSNVVHRNRFYPLATSYYFLSHPGGELWFATDDDPTGLLFSLHPVPAGGETGEVGAAVATWSPTSTDPESLGEMAGGDYWLRGALPDRAENSTRLQVCLGSEADMAACPVPDAGDDAGPDAAPPEDAGPDAGEPPPKDEGGCGCRTAAPTPLEAVPPVSAVALALALVPSRRRLQRRCRPRRPCARS